MLTPKTFEKVLMDLIRPNVSKNVAKKCEKKNKLPKIGDWIQKYVMTSSFQKWS